MANFDNNLSRMEYLMNYKPAVNESKSNVECHMKGADGKVYGIIKEGTKYYIKTTEPGKELMSESYSYINGFNYRNENAYDSYNKATKMLEQKIMALNESHGIHEDVTFVDLNKNEKILEGLTKEARKELDRMKMIMENSDNIGKHGDPESKSDPFSDKVKETLTRDDVKSESDPKKANSDYTDASKCVEKEMASDKAPKCNDTNCENDAEKAKCDIDGVSVAEQEPKGGKAVMVNEDLLDGMDDDDFNDVSLDDFQDDVTYEDDETNDGDDIVGIDNEEEDDFDQLMEEFKERICGDEETLTGPHGTSEVLTVDEESAATQNPKSEEKQEALDGPHGSGKAIASDRLSESMKRKINRFVREAVEKVLKEEYEMSDYEYEDACDFNDDYDDDVVNGAYVIVDKSGKNPVCWIGGSYDAEEVYQSMGTAESYGPFDNEEEAASWARENGLNPTKMVNESSKKKRTCRRKMNENKLHVWGEHPSYGKQPMTTPPDVEVKAGTADKDWNDDSAKGSERYGKKIGNGKPFDKQVDMLTDAVVQMVKEAIGLKKKINEEKTFLKVPGQESAPEMQQGPMPQMNGMQPPIPPMDNNNPMPPEPQGNEDNGESEFDTGFDAGVEADEDEDPKKYIQQLTGKLSQTLNTYNNEVGDDEELSKYVGKMIIKAVAKGLDEKGRKELIKSINTTEEADENDSDETDFEVEVDDEENNTPDEQQQPIQECVFTKAETDALARKIKSALQEGKKKK